MKKLSLILAMLMLFTLLATSASADWAPTQPITIMNHGAAGGGPEADELVIMVFEIA